MAYRIILTPAAERQLDRLRGISFVAARGVIPALRNEQRPPGSIKLSGSSNLWRVRVRVDGRRWRVIYRIDEARQEIVVTRVVPRPDMSWTMMYRSTAAC